MVLCPSQLVERAVHQYISEKAAIEAQLTTPQNEEEIPVIIGGGDQLEEKGGSSVELDEGESGAINGDDPVVEEGNEEAEVNESPQQPTESPAEEMDEEKISEESRDTDGLPTYFSEVCIL